MNFSADQVADYILSAGLEVAPIKLQGLSFYCQAWYLAIFDRPLFPEAFEAWVCGPAIPGIRDRFPGHFYISIEGAVARPDIAAETAALLDEVLADYGRYQTYQLARIASSESPWKQARGDLDRTEPSQAIISEEAMRSYYRKRIADATTYGR